MRGARRRAGTPATLPSGPPLTSFSPTGSDPRNCRKFQPPEVQILAIVANCSLQRGGRLSPQILIMRIAPSQFLCAGVVVFAHAGVKVRVSWKRNTHFQHKTTSVDLRQAPVFFVLHQCIFKNAESAMTIRSKVLRPPAGAPRRQM